jgi:acetamidase/formamidase
VVGDPHHTEWIRTSFARVRSTRETEKGSIRRLEADLDEAAKIATREMLDFLVKNKGLTRDNAYMLASAAMDLIVTQAVDGTKGIHAMIPKGIFRK